MRGGKRNADGWIILTTNDIPDELRVHMKDISEAKANAISRLNELTGFVYAFGGRVSGLQYPGTREVHIYSC